MVGPGEALTMCIFNEFPGYQFPIASITNQHKFSGLKQHQFVILQFGRSEI